MRVLGSPVDARVCGRAFSKCGGNCQDFLTKSAAKSEAQLRLKKSVVLYKCSSQLMLKCATWWRPTLSRWGAGNARG